MEHKSLKMDLICRIFKDNNIDNVCQAYPINIGFTNQIYVVDDKYILKVCVNEENENNFLKERFCYKLFNGRIPVPNIIASDTSKNIINKYYMIYEKIPGDNLYSKWHLLSVQDRRNIVKQLSDIMNRIASADYRAFAAHFKIPDNMNWHDLRYNSVRDKLNEVRLNRILDNPFIDKIEDYVCSSHHSLFEQKMGLTYSDLHFDNVLVSGNKVTGLLDFERIDVLSVDYSLDTIKRLSEYPWLYACEEYEKFVKVEDYDDLFKWFEEFMPSLFNFKHISKRLSIYSLEYDLRMLLKFPDVDHLKERLSRTIGYKRI